jgi:hypothetical protein
MSDRVNLTVSSREQLRNEIAQQTEKFLRHGGHIDVLQGPIIQYARPIGAVWWDIRGGGPLLLGA